MIKNRFREIRRTLGISNAQMSIRIGMYPSLWSQYEQGTKTPRFDTLQALSSLDISLNWLMTGEGSMFRKSGDRLTPDSAPFEQLRKALHATISSKMGDELLICDDILRVLERHPNGASFDVIAAGIHQDQTPERIQKALDGLVEAGMLGGKKELYRLIRVTVTDVHNDGQLRTLMAIRTLIETFLPAVDTARHEDKIMVIELPVKCGQGVDSARELLATFKRWLSMQQRPEASEAYEMIDIVLCILVSERESS